jgi:hypothetical protein
MEKERRNYMTAGTAFQIGSVPYGSAKLRADPEFLIGVAGARIVGAGQTPPSAAPLRHGKLDPSGGSSSAGRASVCGTECRGFKPRLPPHFSLPAKNKTHFVFLKNMICREQSHLFRECLGDEHPVKRVPVMHRQCASTQCVFMGDIERLHGPGT